MIQPHAPAVVRPSAVTAQVGEWISGLSIREIPPELQSKLRLLLLDTIGAGLLGRDQKWTKLVRDWASRFPATGDEIASIWGEDAPSLRPSDAALVNGTAAHAFELDDYHNSKTHPAAVVVPAVLALAEAHGARGEQILTAMAAGYEVMIRSALALDPSHARTRGWHLTGVSGTLGAAAASAVVLGLDTHQTMWALGLAGTQSSGLFAFSEDGTMSKRFHPGRAGQSGIMAAELASLGFTGPTRIFEAKDGGFLRAFSDVGDQAVLTDGLGTVWHSATTSFKPYSSCGSSHSYIDAARRLRDAWKPSSTVRAGVSRVVDLQCGYPYQAGSELNAQLSIRYCVAAALTDGHVLPEQFTSARLADRTLAARAAAVEILHDPDLDELYPSHFSGWVEIETEAGPRRVFIRDPSGHPSSERWEAELREKFRSLASSRLPETSVHKLENCVDHLTSSNARELLSLLSVPRRPWEGPQ
jgi:2-methylcitrate dehydratase PrpD